MEYHASKSIKQITIRRLYGVNVTISIDSIHLVKTINMLKNKLPLTWLKVRILYQIYGSSGKRVSHIRPCFECFKYERGWPCSCLEIVLVPNRNRDIRFSLMHEWGHAYLSDRVDLIFAVTVPCKGYTKPLIRLLEDVIGYTIMGLACDTIVDFVVSNYIKEYKDHIIEAIIDQAETLTMLNGSNNKSIDRNVKGDALICTNLVSLYVGSKALGLREPGLRIAKCFNELNCSINISHLNAIVNALRKKEYLKAYEKLLKMLVEKYLKKRIRLAKISEEDPLRNKIIKYRCIKVLDTTSNR